MVDPCVPDASSQACINSVLARLAAIDQATADDNQNLNDFFLLLMGALVMFMQCGFAFLEAGSVRSKNVTNILIKNVLDMFCGAFVYWAVGYAFAYGNTDDVEVNGANRFIGNKFFFSIFTDDVFFSDWFFQFVFAATASTIVSGAVAERTQFGAYLVYSMVITGFVYPVVCHWCWSSNGWLNYGGYSDFAGSGIVHCCGGAAAFMGALILGPREGRFDKETGKVYHIPGHSVPIAALGGFILFLGFLAFNGGSELAIVGAAGHGAAVAKSFMNTIIGGAGGALFPMVLAYAIPTFKGETAYWSLLTCINGGLAGMVALCCGCNRMHQGTAFATGALGGLSYWWVSKLMKKLKIDDPLDAVAVHYGGGMCGVLFSPVFWTGGIVDWESCSAQEAKATAAGEVFGDCAYAEFETWAWNLCGLVAITAWTVGVTGAMFYGLHALGVLRIDLDIEVRGLDIKKHGEPAYPSAAYGHGWETEGDFAVNFLKTPEAKAEEKAAEANAAFTEETEA